MKVGRQKFRVNILLKATPLLKSRLTTMAVMANYRSVDPEEGKN